MAKKTIEEQYAGRTPAYINAVKEYRQLAKRADQRLVQLEAYQHEKNFKEATLWAYRTAMKDIKNYGGGKRFNIAPPEDLKTLKAKINDIKDFLEKPSSTKRGIISIYKKKADTFNKNNGTNFTWQEVGKMFERGAFEKLDATWGSKTKAQTIAKYNTRKDDIIKAIKDANEKDLKAADEDVQDTINKILADKKVDFSDLLDVYDSNKSELDKYMTNPFGSKVVDDNIRKVVDKKIDLDWEDIFGK